MNIYCRHFSLYSDLSMKYYQRRQETSFPSFTFIYLLINLSHKKPANTRGVKKNKEKAHFCVHMYSNKPMLSQCFHLPPANRLFNLRALLLSTTDFKDNWYAKDHAVPPRGCDNTLLRALLSLHTELQHSSPYFITLLREIPIMKNCNETCNKGSNIFLLHF